MRNNKYEVICPKCKLLFMTECSFCKAKDSRIQELEKEIDSLRGYLSKEAEAVTRLEKSLADQSALLEECREKLAYIYVGVENGETWSLFGVKDLLAKLSHFQKRKP